MASCAENSERCESSTLLQVGEPSRYQVGQLQARCALARWPLALFGALVGHRSGQGVIHVFSAERMVCA